MSKKYLIITGILGTLAVGLGAFGAHGLEARLSASQLSTYQTGVTYHFYHTLALFGCSLLLHRFTKARLFGYAALAFVLGILLFSGSLYLLSCRELIGLTSYRWLGPVTPIGGLFFMAGWVLLSWGAFKNI